MESYTYFFELYLYLITDWFYFVELTSNRLIDEYSCLNAIPVMISLSLRGNVFQQIYAIVLSSDRIEFV